MCSGHLGRIRRGDDEGRGGHELEQVLEHFGAEPACRAGEDDHGRRRKRCCAKAGERGRELDEPPNEHVMAGEKAAEGVRHLPLHFSLYLSLSLVVDVLTSQLHPQSSVYSRKR
jgi:hypothetical protein